MHTPADKDTSNAGHVETTKQSSACLWSEQSLCNNVASKDVAHYLLQRCQRHVSQPLAANQILFQEKSALWWQLNVQVYFETEPDQLLGL